MATTATPYLSACGTGERGRRGGCNCKQVARRIQGGGARDARSVLQGTSASRPPPAGTRTNGTGSTSAAVGGGSVQNHPCSAHRTAPNSRLQVRTLLGYLSAVYTALQKQCFKWLNIDTMLITTYFSKSESESDLAAPFFFSFSSCCFFCCYHSPAVHWHCAESHTRTGRRLVARPAGRTNPCLEGNALPACL